MRKLAGLLIRRTHFKREMRKAQKRVDDWFWDVCNGETLKDEMGNARIWPDKLKQALRWRSRATALSTKVQFLDFLIKFPYPPAITKADAESRITYWNSRKSRSCYPEIEIWEYLGWAKRQYEFYLRTGELPRFKLS